MRLVITAKPFLALSPLRARRRKLIQRIMPADILA